MTADSGGEPERRPEGSGRGSGLPPGQRHTEHLVPMHYGKVPQLHLERWAFTVGGATQDGGQTVVDWPMLQTMPVRTVRTDLHCVSHVSVSDLTWTGVPLTELIRLAPPEPGVQHVLLSAAYGYSAAVPLVELVEPSALLATHLDAQPLTPEQGWPARIVLPHLYAFKGPKWVLAMDYHHEPPQGWWEKHGYHPRARVWDEERYAHQG